MLAPFRPLLTLPAPYRAPPSWPAWLVAAMTLVIVVAAQLLAAAVFKLLVGSDANTLPGLRPAYGTGPGVEPQAATALLLLLLLSQLMTVGLTLLAAVPVGVRSLLKLAPPAGGVGALAGSLVAFVAFVAVFNAIAYLVAPHHMAEDFRAFAQLAGASSLATAMLAIGPGAALSEELLFRGFLLSALAHTRLGYWPSAVLATLAWTLLHWGYSWIGLAEVFLIGLFFSWLLWRTDSLWPSILCHALYNTALLLLLRTLFS